MNKGVVVIIILLIFHASMPELLVEDITASSHLNAQTNVTVRDISAIRVPTDYPTIQEAIDAAPPGSKVFIESGEYPINDCEHTIRIENKNLLRIIGDEDVKLITSSGEFGDLIKIKSSEQITLSGFTVGVERSAKDKKRNIVIEDSNEITLSGLYLYNYATEGASIEHIPVTISNSTNCKIEDCKFMTGDFGSAYELIIGSGSKGNIIENNTFNSDTNSIFMGSTTNNILCDNIIHKIWVGGKDIYRSAEYYSNNNTIYNNKISSISMQGDNNTIYNNTIISLGMGFYPFGGDNNTNNIIYLNNIFGFGKSGVHGNNSWNSTIPVNYTYNGITTTRYAGNFWYDYAGADNNSDGIGDVAYKVYDGNYDYYPLIEPYRLTFDLNVTAIIRPYITYADRDNTILAEIERTGTYLTPEDVCMNLIINDAEVNSKRVKIDLGDNIVKLTWIPPDVGDYKLGIEVHPEDALLSEINDTNNNFSIYVSVSPPIFNYVDNMRSALEFLNESQNPSGSLGGFSSSALASLAIISAGENPETERWKPHRYSLIDYLRDEPRDSAGFLQGSNPSCLIDLDDFARMILVISAIGEDPTNFGEVNYLTMLKSYYDGKQFGDPDIVEDDAFAILALISCGEGDDKTIVNAVNHIKSKQNKEDGGWSSYDGGSDVKATSIVIQALIAAGEGEDSETIKKALDYLKKAQDEDGGYSDVISTSYAIQAIIAAGENPLNWTRNSKSVTAYLLSLQQPDGSFNYTTSMSFFPLRATIFPILGMSGEPYPVMVKTMRGDYELPDISVSDAMIEDEIYVNTSYTVKTNIKSNGGIFYVDLLSDGEFIERKEVYSVWHDSHTSISFIWKPNTIGGHNLTLIADAINNVTEFNETNNHAKMKVNVALPDLYPSKITPPDKTYINVTNTINCTIRGTTDEHFNVTLKADEEIVSKQMIERIRDNTTVSFEWRPSVSGTHNLRFTVDSDSEVMEQYEGNNTLKKSVNVILPDLIPTSITAGEVFVNARNQVNMKVEGFAENFNISLIDNGTIVGKTTNVTCDGMGNFSVYWRPTTLGNHTITAFVDSDDDIKETIEGNNNVSETFEVLLPDLVPEDITPDVLYIDEVNRIEAKLNGTAEGFNATMVADEIIDRSGPLRYVITPIFNETIGESKIFPGTNTTSDLTYNITEQQSNWSWEEIDTLSVSISSDTSTGLVDNGDTWSVDYVAVVVNYTDVNSMNRSLELNANDIVSYGNWSNVNNTYISDDEYATANGGYTHMHLGITYPDAFRDGNITSVVIKVEQRVVNAISTEEEAIMKKTNINTYNGSIAFQWLPMKMGEYKLSVFLDSDNDTMETNETNNNLTKSVLVTSRIDLKLTSPIGGEVWGGVKNITWNASYEEPLKIDILYSPDRGYRWIEITTNEKDDGSYAWNTGDVIDGEYMIKIVARSGIVKSEDMSDVFYVRNKKTGEEWGSFHENAGYAPCDAPDTNEIAGVSEDIGACGASSLIVAEGKVFVYCTGSSSSGIFGGSSYTYLVALDKENLGKILWARQIAPQIYGSWATPAYKDGSVFVSSGKEVYRIDADDGEMEWEFRFPSGKGSVIGGPAVTKRAVYVGDYDGGYFYCINNSIGNGRKGEEDIIWKFDVTENGKYAGHAMSVPAIAYGNAYFGSAVYEGIGKAYSVDATNGTEIWSTVTGVRGGIFGSITVADKLVYFSTYRQGQFYALDAFNGTRIWSKYIDWGDSTPAYYAPSHSTRSYIYVTSGGWSNEGITYCLDAKTGELIWQFTGAGSWTNSPVVTRDGKVFVGKPIVGGFDYSMLYCLDAFTGKEIWHSEHGGSSPVVVDGFVYTIGEGRVIAFGNGTMPDLTVKDVMKKGDSPYTVGEEGKIIAVIENIGKSNVTESFEVELRYKDDENQIKKLEKIVNSSLNINDSKEVSFEWTPEEPGKNRLTVEVDPPPGNVSESNPWNNIANVTVWVEDNKPDLVTTIEKVLPKHAYVGNTVTVEANITNIGYETNKSFWVRFSVNDVEKEMSWISLEDNVRLNLDFKWNARDNGTYNLTVDANPSDNLTIKNEVTWTNNNDSVEKEVMSTPTPTPTPTSITEKPGFGPGSGGGYGGGTAGGIGEGSGTGEAGAGEAGGMQIPVNESGSASETKKEVRGFPFGNATSGAPGGGGTLPILLILLAILAIALFYFGYYKEKRAYRRNRK